MKEQLTKMYDTSTTVIRLHLLLNYLIRAVGYEEARNGTDPETVSTEGIFSSGHSQARKAHEHFTLSVPPRELWQPHLDRLTDFKVTQPSPGSAESLFLRTFLKLGKNLRSSSPWFLLLHHQSIRG